MSQFEPVSYGSYNEFFSRKIRPEMRPVDPEEAHLIAPCDSKLTVLPITPDMKGIAIFTVCQLLNGIGQAVYQCVSYSMIADAIDYNEWKHGVRDEGTTYALHSFCRKLAQSIGPSICLVLATWMGYIAANEANQTPEVAKNMLILYAGMTLFGVVLRFVSVALIYNLDKKTVATMQQELSARRAK